MRASAAISPRLTDDGYTAVAAVLLAAGGAG
jgi:hypothetical protein